MSRQIKRSYEFGPYRIDSVDRRLLRGGEPVPLKAKAVDTLLVLLEHAGEVLEKEDLMRRLWPDSFVEEGNLTQNIYVLRKALAEADYIETVPRRGYRFTAEVAKREEALSDAASRRESIESGERGPAPLSLAAPIEPRLAGHGVAEPLPGAPPSETGPLPAARRESRPWLAIGLVLGVAALGGLGFWLRPSRIPFEAIRLARLTTSGNAVRAAISPEGKYVAYVASAVGRQSLRLRQVATGKDLEIVPPAAVEFYGLTFSRDGNFIYYVSQEMNHVGLLFRVPSLGGTSARLIEDVDSPVTLSPDDKRLAFIRFSPGQRSIVVAGVDGTGERILAASRRESPFQIAPSPLIPPAWSPDGRSIACPVGLSSSGGDSQTIRAFDSQSGAARPLTAGRWQTIGRMEWLADGSGLLAIAAEEAVIAPQQLWLIAAAGGKTRRITNDLADYRDLSLTSDVGTLIAVQSERRGNIWIAPADNPGESTQITSTNYDGLNGLSWTPGGKIVYTLQGAAEQNLWIADPRGGSPEQLTSHAGFNRQPSVSPDGRFIVFVSNRTGREHLWRIDGDGPNPRELTHGAADVDPSFSPDGRWVFFKSLISGFGFVFRVGIEGGEAVRLMDHPAADPVASPDGSLVAVFYRTAPTATNELAVVSSAGGEPRLIRDLAAHFGRFRWTPDGRALAYSARYEGVGNIWLQPLDGGAPRQWTRWGTDPIFFFDWSRDGKWLAYSKGAVTSDVVKITAARR
jgi:Tol biopolymer transport system component/DNA-binding winged helix-turn-helix (wHTH) protein